LIEKLWVQAESARMGRFTAGNNADAERKERFFNAKQRLIGVRNQTA
jgi:hypothetical protein